MAAPADLPLYGLDKEIKEKLDSKLDSDQITQAKQWVETVLGRTLPALDQPTLKDGTILVELLNKVTKSNYKVQKSALPFKQMENINLFLSGAEKLGCPKFDLFMTVDLFENKNFPQVVQCLFSFARHAHKSGADVPLLGPKLNDRQERNFSDEQLQAGRNLPGLLTGFTGGATASGVIYGLPRQIVDPKLGESAAPNLPSQLTGGYTAGANASGVIYGMPRQIVDPKLGHTAPENLPGALVQSGSKPGSNVNLTKSGSMGSAGNVHASK